MEFEKSIFGKTEIIEGTPNNETWDKVSAGFGQSQSESEWVDSFTKFCHGMNAFLDVSEDWRKEDVKRWLRLANPGLLMLPRSLAENISDDSQALETWHHAQYVGINVSWDGDSVVGGSIVEFVGESRNDSGKQVRGSYRCSRNKMGDHSGYWSIDRS